MGGCVAHHELCEWHLGNLDIGKWTGEYVSHGGNGAPKRFTEQVPERTTEQPENDGSMTVRQRLGGDMRIGSFLTAFVLIATACSTADDESASTAVSTVESSAVEPIDFGEAPPFDTGDLAPETAELLTEFSSSLSFGLSSITTAFTTDQLDQLVRTGDGRLLWLFADLMRFPLEGGLNNNDVTDAFEALSGVQVDEGGPAGDNPWTNASNRLIAWDLPAFPGYLDAKRSLFTTLEPKWEPFFDSEADVDWRYVSWGGVLIDDRLVGDGERCTRGCIPALDDPAVTAAAGGAWYPDDAIVFGVEIDGEYRAYPKNMMEIHEMVNDTLGGRRIAIPYCTLCGSAQAYLTDELPSGTIDGDELPIMRTSGLLIRSNKMMFELRTRSLVDTFLGTATAGPLRGESFEQVSVATSTWGAWREAHPETTILAQDGGIGREYAADPLRGRDDDGPIFPIGAVDERLPVQQAVLGITTDDGTVVAVHVDLARERLLEGESIMIDDLEIDLAGDGIRAVRPDGTDIGAHQAFWFAWSQFQPNTLVWPEDF